MQSPLSKLLCKSNASYYVRYQCYKK